MDGKLLQNISEEDYALLEASELEGAVEVESFGMILALFRGGESEQPRILLRCPGFDHEGIPGEPGADAMFAWNLLYGRGRGKAVLVMEWENGAERRVYFDMNKTVRRFFEAALLTRGLVAVSSAARGEIPTPANTLGLDLPIDGAEYGMALSLAASLEAAAV